MSVNGNVPVATTAGRPRSEEAHRAILDATLELLAEVGFSAMTVEGVASRAQVGKATIYRRWAAKLPLVIEAFGRLPALVEADTGDLVADLDGNGRAEVLAAAALNRAGATIPPAGCAPAHPPRAEAADGPGLSVPSPPLLCCCLIQEKWEPCWWGSGCSDLPVLPDHRRFVSSRRWCARTETSVGERC